MIRTISAIQYITPLREGGSLPAVVRGDDGELYAMKFIGAGQGVKALIAELIAGEIGRAIGLRVPEIVFVELDPAIGRSEPDAEIQDLLHASTGLNLALKFIRQASAFNLLVSPPPDEELASTIVWFDAFVTNVDRTPRNVNLLVRNDELWLIDHGASLYFHHTWQNYMKMSESPFPLIKEHVLLSLANKLQEVNIRLRNQLNDSLFQNIIDQIPEAWLMTENHFPDAAGHRTAYGDFLNRRLQGSEIFVKEASDARAKLL